MMTFYEFLNENTGTYVCCKFTEETNKKLNEFAKSLDLTPIKDFHATVVYSEENLGLGESINDMSGSAKITGIEYLGEIGSKYRAIVLTIESEELQELYDLYTEEYGYKSRYPKYTQHVSLMYSPPEDININEIDLPDFDLVINEQHIEKINKDYVK